MSEAKEKDEPIGYDVLLMELRGIFKACCDLYGSEITKQAVKQVYAEVFQAEKE